MVEILEQDLLDVATDTAVVSQDVYTDASKEAVDEGLTSATVATQAKLIADNARELCVAETVPHDESCSQP